VRQSLFFSATIDGKVREILEAFVKNPITVSVRTQETAAQVDQRIIKVENSNKKIEQLHDLLIQDGFNKVLIFGRTKWGVQKLSNELVSRGFKADAIHGNKKQNQRLRTPEKFKKNEITILLATDVASRGLDIHNVSHVINYDMPATREDYIHRIGRTGRADKKGVALTFID
jgi:superfamily II DNA/RNA helicase